MTDLYLAALTHELECTQRILPSNSLFCIPQARSLIADAEITQQDIFSHFLTPYAGSNGLYEVGQYETLNHKYVSIMGSHLYTRKGFHETRKIRILFTEQRMIQHQEITLLHISRPLCGGIIGFPEDLNEIDVTTFRRYTAILRSFPEHELVFYHLDETIAQVEKICRQHRFENRYETSLPQILHDEWALSVEEIVDSGSLDHDDSLHHQASHLLPIQQVVECYLMEKLHDHIFPLVRIRYQVEDQQLATVLYQQRHFTPMDFGIRIEFQCFLQDARNTLLLVEHQKTPFEMLLTLKKCIDQINEGVTKNLKQHHHNLGLFQLTTDDILDALLFVLIQAFNASKIDPWNEEKSLPPFPLVAVLKYVSEYHFINSNTSMLGYTIANFQVAIEYFLMRASHNNDRTCRACNHRREIFSLNHADGLETDDKYRGCSQAFAPAIIEIGLARNVREWTAQRESRVDTVLPGINDLVSPRSELYEQQSSKLFIVGDWSSNLDSDNSPEPNDSATSSCGIGIHPVEMKESISSVKITQLSGGHRFFAVVDDAGQVSTWGDRSGGRLGYPSNDGSSRRVDSPQVVSFIPSRIQIVNVACGAFHTLVTDVNGHLFAWGQNSHGQLGFITHECRSSDANPVVETPTLVADLKGVYMSAVACGEYHSIGLSSDGRVFTWGCNKYSKLGRKTEGLLDAVQPRALVVNWTTKSIQYATRGGSEKKSQVIRRIAAGSDHSVAVSCDGSVLSWGRGDDGQLGHGCYMDVPEPMQVLALADDDAQLEVVEISAGRRFTMFLLRDGSVFVTGQDPSVVLPPRVGDDEDDKITDKHSSLVPHLIPCEDVIIGIACGYNHFALLTCTGILLLSTNLNISESTSDIHERQLQRVQELTGVQKISGGASHTLVLC